MPSHLTLDKQILKGERMHAIGSSECANARGYFQAPSRRRQCIDHVCDRLGVSERRACQVFGQHRSTRHRIPCGRGDEDRRSAP